MKIVMVFLMYVPMAMAAAEHANCKVTCESIQGRVVFSGINREYSRYDYQCTLVDTNAPESILAEHSKHQILLSAMGSEQQTSGPQPGDILMSAFETKAHLVVDEIRKDEKTECAQTVEDIQNP